MANSSDASPSKSNLLRRRGAPDDSKVSFVDLVFVFSIIQLSHTMAHHFTPLGVAETFLLILAVWWVWIFTTWVTNWLDPDTTQVRLMLFALMFLGLVVSASIPEAFTEKGLVFALAFVAMQVGRSLFMLWVLKGVSESNFRNFIRITSWLVVSGLFWIAGRFAHHEMRLGLWMVALAIEYVSPALGFWVPGYGRSTEADWNVSGAHMSERCALFVIICIGETILATGRTFGELPMSTNLFTAFAISFGLSLTMWWVYFRFGHHKAAHFISTSDNPGGVARWAYTYAHIPIVSGVIVAAVGSEFMLKHAAEPLDQSTVYALIGGPCLYLLGYLWFIWVVVKHPPLSHLIGISLFVALAVIDPQISTLTLGSLVTGIMLAVCAVEFTSLRNSA